MLRIRPAQESDSHEWNKLVETSSECWVSHLFEWKDVVKFSGLSPKSLVAEERGRIVGVFPLFFYKLGFFRWLDSVGIGWGGPCTIGNMKGKQIHERLMQSAKEMADDLCVDFVVLRLFPPFLKNWNSTREKHHWLLLHGYRYSPSYCFMLPLDKSLGLISKNLRKDARRSIKKAEKKNLEVKEIQTVDEVKTYHEIHLETCLRTDMPSNPLAYYETLWKYFGDKGILKAFLARSKEEVVAGIMFFAYKGLAYTWDSCSMTDWLHARPNHFLRWEAIKWAKHNGFKMFGIGGVRPYMMGKKDTKPKGIFEFKKSFGGELVEEPAGIKVHSPVKKAAMEFAMHLYNDTVPSRLKNILGFKRKRVVLFGTL